MTIYVLTAWQKYTEINVISGETTSVISSVPESERDPYGPVSYATSGKYKITNDIATLFSNFNSIIVFQSTDESIFNNYVNDYNLIHKL